MTEVEKIIKELRALLKKSEFRRQDETSVENGKLEALLKIIEVQAKSIEATVWNVENDLGRCGSDFLREGQAEVHTILKESKHEP